MTRVRAWWRAHRDALILVITLTLLWAANYFHTQQLQAAQLRQERIVQVKLCDSFGRLAALKPPPGNPADNPSRAYLQQEHQILDDIGSDVVKCHAHQS